MATTVAERYIDYYYDKIEQENKRKYEEIQNIDFCILFFGYFII